MSNKYLEKIAITYREGEESLFTHDGRLFSVDKVLKLTKNKPVMQVPVDKLDWVLEHMVVDKDRISIADLQYPVVIQKRKGLRVVVDGAHRLTKAVETGQSTIKAVYVNKSDLKKARVRN